MFQFLSITILMVLQSLFLIKFLILVLRSNSSRLSYGIKKYQKINFLAPKGSSNSRNMNILSFLYISLLYFNFLRNWKNNPRLKIFLTSVAVLAWISYRSSKLQTWLKSCFTFQFFAYGTIKISSYVKYLILPG